MFPTNDQWFILLICFLYPSEYKVSFYINTIYYCWLFLPIYLNENVIPRTMALLQDKNKVLDNYLFSGSINIENELSGVFIGYFHFFPFNKHLVLNWMMFIILMEMYDTRCIAFHVWTKAVIWMEQLYIGINLQFLGNTMNSFPGLFKVIKNRKPTFD